MFLAFALHLTKCVLLTQQRNTSVSFRNLSLYSYSTVVLMEFNGVRMQIYDYQQWQVINNLPFGTNEAPQMDRWLATRGVFPTMSLPPVFTHNRPICSPRDQEPIRLILTNHFNNVHPPQALVGQSAHVCNPRYGTFDGLLTLTSKILASFQL